MDLSSAATFFDQNACFDAYSNALLFQAQLGLYDDNRRDSETSERRTLSVGPGTVIPARRAILVNGYRFLIGKGNPDLFQGDVIRIGYVAHEASFLATINTLGGICEGTPPTQAWSARAWVKNSAFTEQSSDLAPELHLFFASSESVPDYSIVGFGSTNYIIRSSNPGAAGFIVALGEVIPMPNLESASAVTGFNQITGAETGIPVALNVLRLRWQSIFDYHQKAAPTFGPGEIQVAMAQAVYTPAAGTRLTLSDGQWRVQSVQAFQDAWLCRAVKV